MKYLLIIMMLATCILACGHKEAANSPIASSSTTSSADVLDGTKWITKCIDQTIYKLSFSNGVSVAQVHEYSDPACEVELMYLESQRSYSLNGQNIDYKFTTVSAVITDSSFLTQCNTDSCFGNKKWSLNVPFNVAGKALDASSEAQQKVGDMLYQIYKVDNGALVFGDTSVKNEDGSTSDDRPTTFDETLSFSVQ